MSILYNQIAITDFSPERLDNVIPGTQMEHWLLHIEDEQPSVRYRAGQFGDAVLLAGLYNFSSSVSGAFPQNVWSFGVRVGLSGPITMNRHRSVPLNRLAIWPPGSEIEYMTPSQEEWIVLQVSYERLNGVFSEIHQRDLRLTSRDMPIRELDKQVFFAFQQELMMLFPLLQLHSRENSDGQMGAVLSERVIRSLVRVLGNSRPITARRGLAPGEQVALSWLNRHIMQWKRDPRQPLDLKSIDGVHLRVLQKATRAAYGVSPHRWLEIVRLNAAYRDLLSGTVGSVTDAAKRWHFEHLGRFSIRYRELMGECPRATLDRLPGLR